MPRCSIVIPAYHEGLTLFKVLSSIKEYLDFDYECIVVVDSKIDKSLIQLEKFSLIDPRFKAKFNMNEPGPAGALKTGFINAQGPTIIVLSADGSDDVTQIPSMLYLIERGVLIVSASRFMKGGQMIGSPFIKGLLSKFAGISLNKLRRIGTSDSTNNFKAYSKSFIDSIEIESRHGFEVALELIVKCKKQSGYIGEIPTIWVERQDGISNFNVAKAIPRYLKWYLYAFAPWK